MKLLLQNKYPGYTLLEMLVVLTIFVILSTLSMAAFNGFRDTVTLNEEIDQLKQTIREAQRSSLFLERKPDERWIYGIGIDFSQIGNDGTYRLFKWCAPFNEYGDVRSKQHIPNYNPLQNVGATNGNLNLNSQYANLECSRTDGSGVGEIVQLGSSPDGQIGKNFIPSLPADNNSGSDVGGVPTFLLFESVSGKAFFYDDLQGGIVNYNSGGDLIGSPINFVIEIRAPNTGRLKTITVSNISGKVKVEDSKL